MSETLSILVVQALTYYWRGNVRTADIKLNLAVNALKRTKRLSELDQN